MIRNLLLKLSHFSPVFLFLSIPYQYTNVEAATVDDTVTPYIFYSVSQDSNIFRFANEEEAHDALSRSTTISDTRRMSDTTHMYGAGLNLKVPINRQVILAELLYIENNYEYFDFLDHTYKKTKLDWAWEIGNLWDGHLAYQNNTKLSSFENFQNPVKDMTKTEEYSVSVKRQLTSYWNVSLSAKEQQQRHELSQRSNLDQNINYGVAKLLYISNKYSTIGLRAAFKDASFINRDTSSNQLIDNSYKEYEYRFVVDWNFSTQSRIDGSVGYTRRTHDEISQRDYSGATGELNFSWGLQDKSQIVFSLWRDINAYLDVTSSYVEESGIKIQPVWKITSRQELKLEASRIDREYKGEPGTFLIRKDQVTTTGITYSHSPWDNLKYFFNYKKEKRDSNYASDYYEYNKITATIEISF